MGPGKRMRAPVEDRKRDRAALLGVFPSKKAYLDFKEDDPAVARQAIPLFIRYAKAKGFIQEEKEGALLDFIEQNRPGEGGRTPPLIVTVTEVPPLVGPLAGFNETT